MKTDIALLAGYSKHMFIGDRLVKKRHTDIRKQEKKKKVCSLSGP